MALGDQGSLPTGGTGGAGGSNSGGGGGATISDEDALQARLDALRRG